MKKILLIVLLCVVLLTGCSDTVFDFSKEGKEIRLKNKISVSYEADWDDDDINSWFKCNVFYWKTVPGLTHRQRAEDTGYIVFNTDDQLYLFIHGIDFCDCEYSDPDIGCVDLNKSNIIKVVCI